MNRYYTPTAEVRFSHLLSPKDWGDGSPREYSVELIMDAKSPEAKALKGTIDKVLNEAMPQNGKRAANGMPLKPCADDASKVTLKIKTKEFTNPDGSVSAGPKVVDSKNQPWDGTLIGRGSKVRVAYTAKAWDKSGWGISLYLKAVMVVELVRFSKDEEETGFEAVEGGYAVESPAFGSNGSEESAELVDEFA